MDHYGKDQRELKNLPFRESDSPDQNDIEFYDQNDTDGTFTNAQFQHGGNFFERTTCHERNATRQRGVTGFDQERLSHIDDHKSEADFFLEDNFGVTPAHQRQGRLNVSFGDVRFLRNKENHRGKGPKGYIRSPERILEEACERLMRDSRVDATDIEVEVDDGVITLKGEVHSRNEKKRAQSLVENLSGVQDVFNQLHVKQWTS